MGLGKNLRDGTTKLKERREDIEAAYTRWGMCKTPDDLEKITWASDVQLVCEAVLRCITCATYAIEQKKKKDWEVLEESLQGCWDALPDLVRATIIEWTEA